MSLLLSTYLMMYRSRTIATGDLTNWMDAETGEFNYTGLEDNMKWKAGMFYGMSSGAI